VQSDRVVATTLAVVGAVLLFLGWRGLSQTVFPAEQIPFVASGGLGGLFCLGVAGVLWLSADLHDEWRKLDRIEQRLARWTEAEHEAADLGPSSVPELSLGRSSPVASWAD
jgi:hypothetical protein